MPVCAGAFEGVRPAGARTTGDCELLEEGAGVNTGSPASIFGGLAPVHLES